MQLSGCLSEVERVAKMSAVGTQSPARRCVLLPADRT
jgi:hypothetical protein